MATRWVRVIGDGVAWEGPCRVFHIIFWPDSDADYVDVYDGVDATSGKKFTRIEASIILTWQIAFEGGVRFDRGVYIDGIDSAVETTVVLEPLSE